MNANHQNPSGAEGSASHLLRCPFCGDAEMLQTDSVELEYLDLDEAADEEVEEIPMEAWFVVCGACGAQGPLGQTPEEAERAWNARCV